MTARRRGDRPAPRWHDREAAAVTPDARLAVTYDRLRSGLAWLRRPQRDAERRLADGEMALSIAGEAAAVLAGFCERIEQRRKVTGRDRQPA